MDFQKCISFNDVPSVSKPSLSFSNKVHAKARFEEQARAGDDPVLRDVDFDLREVYFLIMHFLSAGPCQKTFGQFWKELLEHQLLPRRYHAWYSRSGVFSGNENDSGISFPLSYDNLVDRYSHIGKDHLVKLLKQLILSATPPFRCMAGRTDLSAADVPTLLGTGPFSLLDCDRNEVNKQVKHLPSYLRWPHMQADQVRGLSLREIGGGFSKHHRAPSVRFACYAIAKPSTMVQKMQYIKKLRGHRDAVYCAIIDRSGRYMITGSDDRLVKIWSMETAFCLASCRGHEGDITDLAVSSNNALVASASNDYSIRVWRLPDGLPISVLRGHTGAVTAIAFSPRPNSVYQILSSSDDGTCRIWDARYSKCSPRIYLPKPTDSVAGKNHASSSSNVPSSSNGPQCHQILCCAYNANGTVFVTGSSDTFARVWSACKPSTDDSEQLIHEIDVLAGHENDVNYVQFSGCAVASRSSVSDSFNEENIPKFKNSWFSQDNIVTCSRDGSAIIWTPRSRRFHGKVGRWTRAYHLKVPPPPMPPQPPRGGPRQRFLPTPRGVNMIVWSLDNRFVLAAIMDCRICVWNASDGSLVHSLTGHTGSTYVLDVHPFNPRIAMSAGYDGKTIVWDIWEGTPIRIYETGRFKLVDGKFSPDGTSIVLSDDVGQIYMLNTGQGESMMDAKYDQFFLGDYRPLVPDTQGNILDQETQLTPYRRNIQDPLCDSSMIPYPEPYQSTYQRRRLGALGIEWHPPSMKFAVGTYIGLGQEYQVLPLADLDLVIEPLPEFIEAMYWEPENDVINDDNDSEYNVTEEYSSEDEQRILSDGFFSDPECSEEDKKVDGIRRSIRKKPMAEVESMTSSGRRLTKRKFDDHESSSLGRKRTKKSRNDRKTSNRKSAKAKSSRPQRVSARNAVNLFSRITEASTDGEDEDSSEDDSSESGSLLQDSSIQNNELYDNLPILQEKYSEGKLARMDVSEDVFKSPKCLESQTNVGNRRRLVLKFSLRDSKKSVPSERIKTECDNQDDIASSSSRPGEETSKENRTSPTSGNPGLSSANIIDAEQFGNHNTTNFKDNEETKEVEDHLEPSSGYKDSKIRWGEVKVRTSKRIKFDEFDESSDGYCRYNNDSKDHVKPENDYVNSSPGSKIQSHGGKLLSGAYRDEEQFGTCSDVCRGYDLVSATNQSPELKENSPRKPTILRIKSKKILGDSKSPLKLKSSTAMDILTDTGGNWIRSTRNKREDYHDDDENPRAGRKSYYTPKKSNWLLLSEQEEGYRYIPQLGDEVVYLRQGHQEYIESSHSSGAGPCKSFMENIRTIEICLVEDIYYATFPGSGDSCCKITLKFIDSSSSVFGKTFKLTLPELINFPDFFVEKTRYDAAIRRNWSSRDKCLVWWRDDSEEGGSWWEGRILSSKDKSSEFPGSPWERFVIRYKDDPTGSHLHSPWELHDLDSQWEHPHIDSESRSKMLSSFTRLYQSASRTQDCYGIIKLKQIAQKLDFINRFPVPLSPEIIELRLKNNYYRSLEAMKHDIKVMLSNAQAYFAKNVEFSTKMRHLSDWFNRNLSKL